MIETWHRPTAEALREKVAAICELGNRFVGSAGERAARDLIVRELSGLGPAEPRLEQLEVLGYAPLEARCALVGRSQEELPAVGLQFTASADITAPAAYLGNPRDLDDVRQLRDRGVDIAGRVAVVESYWPYLLGEYLVSAGAAAIVIVSPTEDAVAHFTAQLYPPGAERPLPIPGVTVERRAGSRLLAGIMHGDARVRVVHRARQLPVDTANVVLDVPGVEEPNERVIVGAHYDTQYEGVGACDNASGVAALIELAASCARAPRRRTVTFVAFADEEHGFNGAIDYCRRHAGELHSCRAMVCLDALAWAYPARRSLHADPSLQAYASERAAEAGWVPEDVVDASLVLGSDHNAFIDAGVPAAWLWRYPPQHIGYHSRDDVLQAVDFAAVAEVAAASGHLAFSLADDGALRLGRSRPTRRWSELRPALDAA